MALIVAPDEGFDSLVSLEDAAQYMADFGHVWTDDATKGEVALRKATQFLLTSYSIKPECLDPVHTSVKAACCEAAARALKGDLVKDTDGRVKTSQTVGPITTTWAEGVQGGKTSYPVIDALLKGLTEGNALGVKLVRG